MRELYCKNGDGFLALFDLTNPKSIDNLIQQIEFLFGCRETFKTPLVIMGAKCDLVSQRQVSYSDGENLAKRYNAPYFEISAKTRINVFEPMDELIRFSIFHHHDK